MVAGYNEIFDFLKEGIDKAGLSVESSTTSVVTEIFQRFLDGYDKATIEYEKKLKEIASFDSTRPRRDEPCDDCCSMKQKAREALDLGEKLRTRK